MELRTVKGTKDYLPAEKIIQNKVISLITHIYENYGFNPLDTPGLEMQDVLCSKFAGGEEILKEIFTLKDNADRDLGLRYDLTVPFARVIASNPTLKKPFKRYQIGKVWRNGPIKLGRFREFYQCDADVVGISSLAIDAELISMYSRFFTQANLQGYVQVNNRKVLGEVVAYAGIDSQKEQDAILTLDKLLKIGKNGVVAELKEKGITQEQAEKLLSVANVDMTLEQLEEKIGETPGIKELKEVFSYLKNLNAGEVVFNVSLARGLTYYTGTIWEAFLKNSQITSSVGSGGRYDNMVGNFTKTQETIPAVGASFGVDVLTEALLLQEQKQQQSVVKAYIIPLETLNESLQIASELRDADICVDIDVQNRAMRKNMDYVNKLEIPFAIIIGENEINDSVVQLKNMINGEQEQLSVNDCIQKIKNV